MNVTPEKIIESLIKIDKNLDEFGKIYNRIIISRNSFKPGIVSKSS